MNTTNSNIGIDIINPYINKKRINFSPFISNEKDEEDNYIKKCFFVDVVGEQTGYDIQQIVINAIKEYDKSDAVNQFIFNNEIAWFDKSTRLGLLNSITINKTLGNDNIVIWINNKSYTIDCNIILEFLKQLEVYAAETFNVTQTKLNEVNSIYKIDDLLNYNIVKGYPTPLTFNYDSRGTQTSSGE